MGCGTLELSRFVHVLLLCTELDTELATLLDTLPNTSAAPRL